MKQFKVPIEEALDWELDDSLRQTLVNKAREEFGDWYNEIVVRIEGDNFVMELQKEEEPEISVTVTARYLLDKGLWADYCELSGTMEWAINEGRMSDDEKIHLTQAEAKQLGILQ